MPAFRRASYLLPLPDSSSSLTAEQVRAVLADCFHSRNFFVGVPLLVEWHPGVVEEIPWEIFKGRLLDAAQTRQRQRFLSWNLFSVSGGERSAEPVLSLKLDDENWTIHITRAILSYAWEGYDAGGGVFLSRETRKWVREVVGTVSWRRFASWDDLQDEVIARLFQAIVGTSRLPLTSLEAPLPDFSLGRLAYVYQAGAEVSPMKSHEELLTRGFHAGLAWSEKTKLLESYLHAVPFDELGRGVEAFVARWQELGHSTPEVIALLRSLFNEAALSPYTDLVDKALAFLDLLVAQGNLQVESQVDFLATLLLQLCRHLTAYDLVTFHHRGANYPDALLLDAALKRYLWLIEQRSDLFLGRSCQIPQERLRRRALRQAWLIRRRYEGHPVPDQPTSPGENARILPPPFQRVPEEQILDPSTRRKRLYDGDPLTSYLTPTSGLALQESVADLHQSVELRELGMALFLDRPLGGGKMPGQPDQTLLFSYEAFSRSIAEKRLLELAKEPNTLLGAERLTLHQQALRDQLFVVGIPLHHVPPASRPGTVSLADARQAAGDFVILRCTRSTVEDFQRAFDFESLTQRFDLSDLMTNPHWLVLREWAASPATEERLSVYDARLDKRLALIVDLSPGYESRAGIEYPVGGLRVVSVWMTHEGELREHDLRSEQVVLRPL